MTIKSTIETNSNYYDDRVAMNLEKFVSGNKRIQLAWRRVFSKFKQSHPIQIVDFGCGIGETAWRCSLSFPSASVVGIDPSPISIQLAKDLFAHDRVKFHCGSSEMLEGMAEVDLVMMIDVVEHIAPDSRSETFERIERCLSKDAILFLTFPTPEHLDYLRRENPAAIQPIDENINLSVLGEIEQITHTKVLSLDRVSVWRSGDYCHTLMARNPWNASRVSDRLSGFSQILRKLNPWTKEAEMPDSRRMRQKLVSSACITRVEQDAS